MKRETPAVLQVLDTEQRYKWAVCHKRGEDPEPGGVFDAREDVLPDALLARGISPVTMGLPSCQLVIRILNLPLTDPDEVDGAVALQVDKFSPFPIEQMVFSYEVLHCTEDSTRVLVAAAQNAWVERACAPFRSQNVPLSRLDCTALGYWDILKDEPALRRDGKQVLVLTSDREVVVLIHYAGQLVGLSGLGDPGDWADPDACQELAEEVARVVLEYEAEYEVTGTTDVQILSDPAMHPSILLLDAVTAALTHSVKQADDLAFPDGLRGLARRATRAGESELLNLMPKSWLQEAGQKRFRRKLVLLAAWLAGLWVMLALGGWGYLYWQQQELTRLRVAERTWRESANDIRRLRLQVTLIDRYQDRTQSALECLRAVSMLLPEGVDLTAWTYRKEDGLELVGEAERGDLVLTFNERLNASPLFGEVRAGTRTRTRQGKHRFTFELSLAGEDTP